MLILSLPAVMQTWQSQQQHTLLNSEERWTRALTSKCCMLYGNMTYAYSVCTYFELYTHLQCDNIQNMHIVAATHRVFTHMLFAAWHKFLRGSGKPQSCCAAASIWYMPLGSAQRSSTALKCLLSLPISLCFVDVCCVIGSMFATTTADFLSKACLHNLVAGL